MLACIECVCGGGYMDMYVIDLVMGGGVEMLLGLNCVL